MLSKFEKNTLIGAVIYLGLQWLLLTPKIGVDSMLLYIGVGFVIAGGIFFKIPKKVNPTTILLVGAAIPAIYNLIVIAMGDWAFDPVPYITTAIEQAAVIFLVHLVMGGKK
jgi:hypothetical protein